MTKRRRSSARTYLRSVETCPRCGKMWCCREHGWESARWAAGSALARERMPRHPLRLVR